MAFESDSITPEEFEALDAIAAVAILDIFRENLGASARAAR
jgi:hypothetical protein